MKIEICKWYKNADSPVLFFIDDLTNLWVDVNGNGIIDMEEDWGYAKDGKNSSFNFLVNNILCLFPEVKVTFFTPVGARVGMIENPEISSVSKAIDFDEESRYFFRKVNDNSKFEIAYHGTNHGKVGRMREEFRQEWETYQSLDEAVDTINSGREIYKGVFGTYPNGGKYCGYMSNGFSDESIDKTGFKWWCRFWNRGMTEGRELSIGGNDRNPITNFDLKVFGRNEVVDIPSTVSGNFFTYILKNNLFSIKGILKFILKRYLINKKNGEINFLLQKKLVISIQEHISPARDDGRRQAPNIFDDRESLIHIFDYLRNKKVWYCTGTELAEYYMTRSKVLIETVEENEFVICNSDKLKNRVISLMADDKYNFMETPEGIKINKENGCFSFKICRGIYKLTGTE